MRIRDLALVAMASGLLAFEVTSLKGALPVALQTLTEQAVPGDVTGASKDAAMATASVFRGVGTATSHAVVGAVKGAARLLGTVTPPVQANAVVLLASREHRTSKRPRACVITVTERECGAVAAARRSSRRAREALRTVESALRQSAL